jgi:hypothetical protein
MRRVRARCGDYDHPNFELSTIHCARGRDFYLVLSVHSQRLQHSLLARYAPRLSTRPRPRPSIPRAVSCMRGFTDRMVAFVEQERQYGIERWELH